MTHPKFLSEKTSERSYIGSKRLITSNYDLGEVEHIMVAISACLTCSTSPWSFCEYSNSG